MRLDWFLPFLRKPKKGEAPAAASVGLGGWVGPLRRVLPAPLFSDATGANPGRLRRWLKRVGPSWHSSPVRRAVQAGAFVLWCVLFFWVSWPYGGRHYEETRSAREFVDAELFLALDPLVALSTALAGKTWVWSLVFAAAMLGSGVLIPRGFCGYLCPLGTLIDLFDWAVGRRVTRFRIEKDGGWVHLKYYLLLAVMAAAAGGVLLSGFVAAIPVLTRGLLFVLEPFLIGTLRGGHLIPPMNAGHFVSIALFAAVLAMGLWRPRFWCRYVCPSGALLSVGNLARATERKVESTCIHCNKCIEICPFDAIKADFTTRTLDCTLCQSCGGVCPTYAIKFVGRWDQSALKAEEEPPTSEVALSRRGFLGAAAAGAAAAAAGVLPLATSAAAAATPPIRPPGSVPEPDFLQLCIRCEACVKACPNNVLHSMGFAGGWNSLWTPEAVPNFAGCEPSCNNCGQVCPTGAIRALPLEEKAAARMGLAVVDEVTCLPFAGREACQMCVDECDAAGYHAIEFLRVHAEVDEAGAPVEGSGFVAPVVLADRCVGCGLCQTRCWGINVVEKRLLADTAIAVFAGAGKEDRIFSGSYLTLRAQEKQGREEERARRNAEAGVSDDYLPDFLDK